MTTFSTLPAAPVGLDLGLPGPPAVVVRRAAHHVDTRSVVVNLADEPAYVGGRVRGHLPARVSSIVGGAEGVEGVEVTGELLLVVPAEPTLDEAAARAAGWHDFYGRPDTVLLRGPQQCVATIEVDLAAACGGARSARTPVEVRVNLWFSPAGTDCGRHDQHAFLEVHTQVEGHGVMEKFSHRDAAGPYEEQLMAPGATGAAAFCRYEAGSGPDPTPTFTYPWHQYRAVTDATWLAVEYHPAA